MPIIQQQTDPRPFAAKAATAYDFSVESAELPPPITSEALQKYRQVFGQSFAVLDTSTGTELLRDDDVLPCDYVSRLGIYDEVVRRGRPEIVEEESPLAMLAIPLPARRGPDKLIAVASFVTDAIASEDELTSAARVFDIDRRDLLHWALRHRAWPPYALLPLAESVSTNLASQETTERLQQKVTGLSDQVLSTFEEITLLHRLTQHLSLSSDVQEVCELATSWLADVIPAKCLAVALLPTATEATNRVDDYSQTRWIAQGNAPVTADRIAELIDCLGPETYLRPVVRNADFTSEANWKFPEIDAVISVPIREGDKIFGWLFAFNHTGERKTTGSETEFGTVEASLMSSVAVILGIHSGNLELYREQSDFFASMVRAMTSAIDAKDPYTCGHSERVARLSVCLARQLGCTIEELNTLYLSGLLHDIGKIGVDTNVLRKPGDLTDEEYEHIKKHPQLGYEILHGIKQLDEVLPVVLHHHEAWDGSGYPHGLKGEECPKLARIAAVADSIDAMSSDRPYRRGMPDEKMDRILKEGAGKQWDERIIAAVFEVREQIREIGRSGREHLSLDVSQWA